MYSSDSESDEQENDSESGDGYLSELDHLHSIDKNNENTALVFSPRDAKSSPSKSPQSASHRKALLVSPSSRAEYQVHWRNEDESDENQSASDEEYMITEFGTASERNAIRPSSAHLGENGTPRTTITSLQKRSAVTAASLLHEYKSSPPLEELQYTSTEMSGELDNASMEHLYTPSREIGDKGLREVLLSIDDESSTNYDTEDLKKSFVELVNGAMTAAQEGDGQHTGNNNHMHFKNSPRKSLTESPPTRNHICQEHEGLNSEANSDAREYVDKFRDEVWKLTVSPNPVFEKNPNCIQNSEVSNRYNISTDNAIFDNRVPVLNETATADDMMSNKKASNGINTLPLSTPLSPPGLCVSQMDSGSSLESVLTSRLNDVETSVIQAIQSHKEHIEMAIEAMLSNCSRVDPAKMSMSSLPLTFLHGTLSVFSAAFLIGAFLLLEDDIVDLLFRQDAIIPT